MMVKGTRVMAELTNCPRCGKLFVRSSTQKVCPPCMRDIERDFEKVYQFLRKKENRQSTIYEVSERTGVTVNQITEFIKEGRIRVADYPNMAYPCERCGEVLITEGRFCRNCQSILEETAAQLQEMSETLKSSTPTGEGYLQKKKDDLHRLY